jgi:DNA-binding MarR family transcriptional regulator
VARTPGAGAGETGQALLLPLIHGRVRLMVLSFLLRGKKAVPFTALRDELRLTDGTLSVHLSKLEQGELVLQEKTFVGKRPLTMVKVTPKGKRLFQKYVSDLRKVVPGLGEE